MDDLCNRSDTKYNIKKNGMVTVTFLDSKTRWYEPCFSFRVKLIIINLSTH